MRKIRLVNEPSAIKRARDEVAAVLRADGWPDHAIDKARVVASELATNAMIHARAPYQIVVRLDPGGRTAWIEVVDPAVDAEPRLAEPGRSTPGGMGLYFVDAMATDWGVTQRPGTKVVWARLDLDAADQP